LIRGGGLKCSKKKKLAREPRAARTQFYLVHSGVFMDGATGTEIVLQTERSLDNAKETS
jgi:hypothetical protein